MPNKREATIDYQLHCVLRAACSLADHLGVDVAIARSAQWTPANT